MLRGFWLAQSRPRLGTSSLQIPREWNRVARESTLNHSESRSNLSGEPRQAPSTISRCSPPSSMVSGLLGAVWHSCWPARRPTGPSRQSAGDIDATRAEFRRFGGALVLMCRVPLAKAGGLPNRFRRRKILRTRLFCLIPPVQPCFPRFLAIEFNRAKPLSGSANPLLWFSFHPLPRAAILGVTTLGNPEIAPSGSRNDKNPHVTGGGRSDERLI
jgi:hypothetical protein